MEGNAEKPDLTIPIEISERRLAFGGTSQLARFFFSRVLAPIMASLGSAALVVPSLEGLLAGVMRVLGTPVSHGGVREYRAGSRLPCLDRLITQLR